MVFDEIADPYLRERKGDVADLVGRLKMNLRQGVATPRDLLRDLDESSVLIADELTPSLAAQVDWTKVRGFATDAGSRTYHTAILARSLDLPAVVGLHNASELIQAGQMVVIDGNSGEVWIEPTDEMLARAVRHADDHPVSVAADAERRRPAVTADGVAHSPRRQHRVSRRPGRGAVRRRRGDRPVSVGVSADERRRGERGRAVRDLPRDARRHGAGHRHRADLRR